MERKNFIGGSDIAVIAGLSKYKTPLELYLEKRGEINPSEDNRILRLGRKLESLIAEEYTIETGEKLRKVNKPLVDKKYPFLQGHIDRLVVGKNKFLEIKSTRFAKKDEWNENKIPDSYMLQVQFYFGLSDFEECAVPLLEAGQSLKIYRVEKDEELIRNIKTLAIDFWDKIQKGEIPDPISENDCKLLYDTKKGKSIVANSEISQKIIDLKKAKSEIKKFEKIASDLSNEIKIYCQDNEILVDNNNTTLATLNISKSERINLDRLRKEQPEIAREYTEQSKTITLRIK
jgi:putative phage-type endonuclease